MERAIIFGVQDHTLALLPMTTRATFRHAWQALYRNLTLVDVKGVPFSLDRVVYETLTSLSDAARRLARAHVSHTVDETARTRTQGLSYTKLPPCSLRPISCPDARAL